MEEGKVIHFANTKQQETRKKLKHPHFSKIPYTSLNMKFRVEIPSVSHPPPQQHHLPRPGGVEKKRKKFSMSANAFCACLMKLK